METTLGGMFLSRLMEIPKYGTIKFNIWDTAGQEKYRCVASMYYNEANAAILVYSLDDRESYKSLDFWINELKENAPPNIRIFIVANKSDLVESEAVSLNEGKELAERCEGVFKTTSAKENIGITDLFTSIGLSVAGSRDCSVKSKKNRGSKLSTINPGQTKSSCCN